MIETLRSTAVRWVFGGGLGASLADRGIDWLAEESRKAIGREPEHVTQVRLRPGETFTVLARPPATRKERKLAKAARNLGEAEDRLSAATGRQRRAARRLRRAQRRLDRTRPGSRRHRRRAAAERKRAGDFDAVMTPSKKLVKVRLARAVVDKRLEASRRASLAAVSQDGGAPAVTVYD